VKQNTPVDAFLTSSLGKFNKKLASQLGLIHSVVFTNFCLIAVRNNNLFPYLIPDIAKDAFIHVQTATKAVGILVEEGFIKRKRRGIPSKVWYSINEERLEEFMLFNIKEDK
jgi:DNA-binding MarR family transcriptional regulator